MKNILQKCLQLFAYENIMISTTTQEERTMDKFTTKQLQDALVDLYAKNDEDSKVAYAMAFDELHRRMGDEAFDAFLDKHGL